MNEAHKELIRQRYENAVHEYCHAYCCAHGCSYNPDAWLDGEVGTCLEVEGALIDFKAIKKYVDNGIEPKTFKSCLAGQTDELDFMQRRGQ